MTGCVEFLMSCLKKERERPVAFRAVGQMVLVLKDRMDLQPVIQMVKTNLPIGKDVGGKRGSRGIIVPDPAVFLCISMLARAVGPNIEVEIRPVLDQIFALGLSIELTNALKVLAREIPSLQKDIQDEEVRECVLLSLDEKFDTHLAQAENLTSLFIAIYDGVFRIRELAMCTIGRLSNLNPAYVMPTLRKVLIQILTELEYSGIGRNKEQSARLLGHLIANGPKLVKPYQQPILKVLIPKLKEPGVNPNVTVNIMAAIGELAQVAGVGLRPWVKELCPIIMEMLQDASSVPKREVALWTLGQVVENAGYVIEPYYEYPDLLDVLFNFLKTEQTPAIRREVIRVLGLLGALDPHKHKVRKGRTLRNTMGMPISKPMDKGSKGTGGPADSASELLVQISGNNLDDFYPAVAISSLMKILKDQSLSQHHVMAIQALGFIFKSLGMKSVPYLPQVM
uniref:Serine/threonine-protein kinase TOR n=1 Tax=Amphimedon queenslandica TaxID=400682 RepID=A0A1X7TJN2_AMPQE